MKTFRPNLNSKRAVLTLALAAGLVGTAFAEPVKPAGAAPDSRIQASKTVAHNAAPQSWRQWASVKYHEIKSYLFNGAPASAPSAVAGAAPKAVAPVGALVAPPVAAYEPRAVAPPVSAPLEKTLRAPAAAGDTVNAPADHQAMIDAPGVTRKSTGVPSYDVAAGPSVPRLHLEKEDHFTAGRYALDARLGHMLDEQAVHEFDSPALTSEAAMKQLTASRAPVPGAVQTTKDVVYPYKGKIDRTKFDAISLNQKPETAPHLKKFVALTTEEAMFLSGLLLYHQGQQCPSALGLFHKLSKVPGWQAESNYYLAMCSKKLNLSTDFHERSARVLETKDVYYSRKIMAELGYEVPYEVADDLGNALMKATTDAKVTADLKPQVRANVAFLLADWAVTSQHFTTALTWAKQVPADHPKYLQAQFLLALAEYEAGSKENATKIEDAIVNDKTLDKSKFEFQALVALNAGRMNFQEQNFKAAHEFFGRVYKDHPLWLESLTEMGWSQLMDGDFEGAIGNMYSIQSPFFQTVYKPESYVIRTIGYLDLCQYGDAYKTLSILEHDYRPYLSSMEKYIAKNPSYYQTVKNFLTAPAKKAGEKAPEVDGLPSTIVREMARHRDFTNLQRAFNRLIDERPNYNAVNGEVERSLKQAQAQVNSIRKNADDLRRKVKIALARRDKFTASQMNLALEKTLDRLNDAFFKVDLFAAAKAGMDEYRKEVVGGADRRITRIHSDVEHLLANRLLKMKVDLARMLDNNELLRYEVFAGSGENIRYQVAGGEVANRVPASAVPKSKSLQWDFDGEYWEDEIGNYRSSLKNNCPKTQSTRAQASLDGGSK